MVFIVIFVVLVIVISVGAIISLPGIRKEDKSTTFKSSAETRRQLHAGNSPTTTVVVHVDDLKCNMNTEHVIIDLSFESLQSAFSSFSFQQGNFLNETVKQLTLKSPLTRNALFYILQRFSTIEKLVIDVDAICLGLRIQVVEETISTTIHLNYLLVLNLNNGVRCPVFDWGFEINIPRISCVQISHFHLNPGNLKALHTYLHHFVSLKELVITLSYVCPEDGEDFCGANKLRFDWLEKFKMEKRISDESHFLENTLPNKYHKFF